MTMECKVVVVSVKSYVYWCKKTAAVPVKKEREIIHKSEIKPTLRGVMISLDKLQQQQES